ncbi:MAG: hypothetical protein RLY93_17815 [Sumerlaeia bacterium]
MKKTAILAGVLALAAGSAMAQTTLIEDFSTSPTGDFGYRHGGPFGGEAINSSADNAPGSAGGSLRLLDGGFSFAVGSLYPATVPSASNYKLTFFYKNGENGNDPLRGLTVTATIDGNVEQVVLSETVAPVTPTSGWTAAETAVVSAAAGADVDIEISSNSAGGSFEALFDEFVLEEVLIVPITVRLDPPNGFWIDGGTSVTAVVSGGTGTYTQVEFDADNDGTPEATDTTPGDGFTFDFDTTAFPDGVTTFTATAEDDSTATGASTVFYTIDNTAGVETVFASSFADGFSTQTISSEDILVPNGWHVLNTNDLGTSGADLSNVTVEEETVDTFDSVGSALAITFAASDFSNRYTLRSDGFEAGMENFVMSFAGKGGGEVRLAYFQSTDGGVSWQSTSHLLNPNSTASAYVFAVDSAYDAGLNLGDQLAVATHKFNASRSLWDDVTVTATNRIEPASANTWDLYQ